MPLKDQSAHHRSGCETSAAVCSARLKDRSVKQCLSSYYIFFALEKKIYLVIIKCAMLILGLLLMSFELRFKNFNILGTDGYKNP